MGGFGLPILTMKNLQIIKDIQLIAVIFFTVALLSLCFGGYEAIARTLDPKGRVSCRSFNNYEDALRAYSAGATWLDRGGVPGRPCEALYKRDTHGE